MLTSIKHNDMKKVFQTAFLIFFVFKLSGQESVNNFFFETNEVYWQKVYETTLSSDKMSSLISESGLFEKVDVSENGKFSGNINLIGADYRGAGYSEMNTPIYVARSFFSGFVVIEIKEGRYRVTLKRILLSQKYDTPISEMGEMKSLETYAIKKGKSEFTPGFMKIPSKILDYTFSNLFLFNEKSDQDDW